jgi:hypothetical protein
MAVDKFQYRLDRDATNPMVELDIDTNMMAFRQKMMQIEKHSRHRLPKIGAWDQQIRQQRRIDYLKIFPAFRLVDSNRFDILADLDQLVDVDITFAKISVATMPNADDPQSDLMDSSDADADDDDLTKVYLLSAPLLINKKPPNPKKSSKAPKGPPRKRKPKTNVQATGSLIDCYELTSRQKSNRGIARIFPQA